MRKFNFRWQVGRVRKHATASIWWRGDPLPEFWRFLSGRRWWRGNPELAAVSLSSGRWQDRCFCREGRTTWLDVEFLGFVIRVEVSRNWVESPCGCDKLVWLMFPDNNEDAIEEYGLARLQSEFPGIGPVCGRAVPSC